MDLGLQTSSEIYSNYVEKTRHQYDEDSYVRIKRIMREWQWIGSV